MSDGRGQDSAPPPECLLGQYSATGGVFDEMEQAPAVLRPHWRPLMASLERLGRHELSSRWESSRRILREHGVTYNIYGDPAGMDRRWELDLLPLLISAEEWASVEAGLIQRSRLFNLILSDLYGGSQRLLRDGFLPPELVYANPGFLRPCRGIPVKSQVYLHLHACDLGRSPEGKWWVLSDRTQAPSGTGYAWENRTVISRVLPEEIRNCNVKRLGNFFVRQRELLFSLAPAARDHPNVVLLTPGPRHETYFEHAYLARHLGFGLVEGADLTVRDRRVFLKTIEGLQPVDVILRRVDDAYCDPLELRSDSFLGVSGLVEAARAGNVTVANALGSGLLESPAFFDFLPTLCRHLLGEELLLASLPAWWCGQPESLKYVTEHLENLIVHPAFPGSGTSPLPELGMANRAGAAERSKLLEIIKASPGQYVAHHGLKLSRAPVWAEGRLLGGSVVLRAYVAQGSDSVEVLPGGLARISQSPEELVLSMHSGGESKDTWILSNGSKSAASTLELTEAALQESEAGKGRGLSAPGALSGGEAGSLPAQRIEETTDSKKLWPSSAPRAIEAGLLGRSPAGVPSRAADHLFWLGRYTERLEQLLRVLRCILGRISGEPVAEAAVDWAGLSAFAAKLGLIPVPMRSATDTNQLADQMLALLYQPDAPDGVRELLSRIHSIAAAVRDRFSGDMWRVLGRLEMDGRARLGRLPLTGATALIHNLVFDLAAFNGMEMENMTRGYGWRFLDFGRRLERGLSVLKLVTAAAGLSSDHASVLDPVLEIADSVMTYRRRYFARPRWLPVFELLLRDETNPRSLAFQIQALGEHAHAMLLDLKTAVPDAEQGRIHLLASALRSADLKALSAQRSRGDSRPLMELLERLTSGLAEISNEVNSRYFSHTAPRLS